MLHQKYKTDVKLKNSKWTLHCYNNETSHRQTTNTTLPTLIKVPCKASWLWRCTQKGLKVASEGYSVHLKDSWGTPFMKLHVTVRSRALRRGTPGSCCTAGPPPRHKQEPGRTASHPSPWLTCLGGGGEDCVSDEEEEMDRGPHHYNGRPVSGASTKRSQWHSQVVVAKCSIVKLTFMYQFRTTFRSTLISVKTSESSTSTALH